EGWTLSGRFERALRVLADKIAQLKRPDTGAKDKDEFLLQLAAARRGDEGISEHEDQPRHADGGEMQ
ncbi:MAG: hypothetical protein JXO22_13485, partial [Phycisphaerae bacterium]|nr:hypothetical protein [Phycisphaerae bacterium]